MIYLGCDPGSGRNMAVAMIDDQIDTVAVQLVNGMADDLPIKQRAALMQEKLRDALVWLGRREAHAARLALEWQRPLPTDKRPANICDLSAFAGIALATLQAWWSFRLDVVLPNPEEWKGQVPKHVMHNRIVNDLGVARVVDVLEVANIPVPKNLGSFDREFSGLAGNAIDALGLALWAKREGSLLSRARSRLSR